MTVSKNKYPGNATDSEDYFFFFLISDSFQFQPLEILFKKMSSLEHILGREFSIIRDIPRK